VQGKSDDNSYKIIDIKDEIGATNDDLEGFVLQFSLELCGEYDEHKRALIAELSAATGVSVFESEKFIYPSALTLIATLACKDTAEKRTIAKEAFLSEIRPNRALYSLWSLREKGKQSYCREMRSRYFCCRNIDPEARFFILDLPERASEADMMQALLAIRKKWSSHRVIRKPDSERYAPFIYFKNTAPDRLARIKTLLHQKGCVFVDCSRS
jgi:hypothetical protein